MWGSNYGYGYPMMGGHWGFELFGVLFSVFVVVVFIAIVIALIRHARGGKSMWHCRHFRGGDDALAILRERYARGEIDHEEFEQKRKDLSA